MPRPYAPDTWGPRALPVLVSIVTRLDEQGAVGSSAVVDDTGLDEETVSITCQALRDGGYITYDGGAEWDVWIRSASREARQIAGAWPTADSLADRLTDAVARGLEQAGTEDERSRWQKLAAGLASAGREIVVQASGAALGGALS